jgi:hypothetical protein
MSEQLHLHVTLEIIQVLALLTDLLLQLSKSASQFSF